jgi:hypothetical protein
VDPPAHLANFVLDAFYLAVVVAAVAFAGFFDAVAGFAAAGAGTAVA